MALTVIASDTGDFFSGSSADLGPFTVAAGDALVVFSEIYRVGSTGGTAISDNVNGAWGTSPVVLRLFEGDGDSYDVLAWALPVSAAGTITINLNPDASSNFGNPGAIQIRADSGVIEQVAGPSGVVSSSPFSATTTAALANYILAGAGVVGASSVSAMSISSPGVEVVTINEGDFGAHHGYRIHEGTTTPTMTWTFSTTGVEEASGYAAVILREVVEGATVEVAGHRWYNDDGDEDGSTAAAAQDANITVATAVNYILRKLLQADGDPDSTEFTARYQKNGTGGYVLVTTAASSKPTPAVPTSATGTTIGTAADPWAINRATASTGDMVIFCLTWDDSTNVTTVTPPAGPNGETAVSIAGPVGEDGSPDHRQQAWYYIATGSWSSGTLSFDPSASETVRAESFVIPAGTFDPTTPIGASATLQGGSAGTSATSPTFSAGSSDGGGRLFIFWGKDTASNFTAPGANWTTTVASNGGAVGMLVGGRNAAVTDSESIGALTATLTSETWACIAWIVRAPTVQNQLFISPSSNITNGEATTSRLSGGTGSFDAGALNDTANGITVNLGNNNHSEAGWSFQMNGSVGLEQDDYFEVKVYNGETALAGTAARITVAAEGTDIDAGTDGLVISEQAAAVRLARNVVGGVDALAITEQPAAVKVSRAVAAALDALVITEYPAAVSMTTAITATADALVIAEQAANVGLAKDIAAGTDPLVLTEYQAAVGRATDILAGADSLTISELPAVVRVLRDIAAGLDALTISEHPAAIAISRHVQAGFDALVITELQAQVAAGSALFAGFDALNIAEQQASIALARAVLAGYDELQISEQPAGVTISRHVQAAIDTLLIAEFAATVSAAKNVAAGADALIITEHPASVSVGMAIAAGLDLLTIDPQAATIRLARHVAGGLDALLLTEQPAQVRLAKSVQAGTDALAITENQAVIELARGIIAGLDALVLTEQPAQVGLARDIAAAFDALLISESPAQVDLVNELLAGFDQLVITEHQADIDTVLAQIFQKVLEFIARAPRERFQARKPQERFTAQPPPDKFTLH